MSGEHIYRDDGSEVRVGDRLVCDGFYCTLRYVGPVPPTKGVWLGVEWDDKLRGKHNGTHEEHVYFTTSHPKSGSFIRLQKASFGQSFMLAVTDRYGKIDDDTAGVITKDLFVVGGNKKTVVEMVGAKKVNELQGKLDKLHDVAVRSMLIYGTTPSHDLAGLVPNIINLDISQNLLSSWKHVAEITKQLRNLQILNVSENRLEIPHCAESLVSSLSHVIELYLNRMEYTWKQILACCDMFPKLETLHACSNCIKELSDTGGRLQNVRLVNLQSNCLLDWSQLLYLGHLPSLETLIVSENGISRIHFDSNGTAMSTDLFSNLHSLTISNNNINEWTSINELNKLKCLSELQLKDNPLMDSANPQTVRQLLIAKLKHLKMCNRTMITTEERKGAEIDYLKRFGPEWVKAGGSQNLNQNNPSKEFVASHPRFQDFIQIWGAPEDSEMTKQSESLKSSLISVTISCPSMPGSQVLEKKLPGTMTIQKLKTLIHRLYKPDSEIHLSYISQKMAGKEIELDNDQQFLSYYSVENGDKILVKI